MAQAIGYSLHVLVFYNIPHPPLLMAKKDNVKALISVVGGILGKEQVTSHP